MYVCKACVNKLSSSLLHFADADAPVEFLILFTNYISLLAFASRNIDRAQSIEELISIFLVYNFSNSQTE